MKLVCVIKRKYITLFCFVFIFNYLLAFCFLKMLVKMDKYSFSSIPIPHPELPEPDESITAYSLLPVNGSQSDDRILKQLAYRLPERGTLKTVLVFGFLSSKRIKEINNDLHSCHERQCLYTRERNKLSTADAVIFKGSNFARTTKNPGQVWIFYQLESPLYTLSPTVDAINNAFNFTATYRRDSVLVTPYEKFVPYSLLGKQQNLSNITPINYAKGKTQLVAWFVSRCRTTNGRLQYVEELQKYISVDIYGKCGPLRCDRKSADMCNDMLKQHYKFYLAFENANCVDYITEKLYWNGFNNDVIPVVMGARPEDYHAVVPPHSIIHVDDFQSPKHLAEYLHQINQNDTLYNSYFKWKGTGEFINTKMWCRICSVLHASDKQKIRYNNLTNWWAPEGICVMPKEQKWSTWKHVNSDSIKIPSPILI